MKMDLSVVICAHNSSARIAPVLAALSEQRVESGLNWEVILVDNASSDGTGEISARLAGEKGLGLKVVHEPRPGLTHARRRGVAEARGQIVSFVDDDNIVSTGWVEACFQFMRDHPRAGLIGGKIKARFVDPASKPADFEQRFAEPLACWDHGDEAFRYPPPVHYPPCGAGLTMRREILQYIYEECGCHLSGRTGGRLISGEDYELGLLALRMGWEAWYAPSLQMHHVLPPSRLTEDYLRRLRLGNAESERWLDYLREKEPKRGRFWYLNEWFNLRRGWAKMKLLELLRRSGHPDSTNYPYWAEEQRLRAIGAWRLFKEYPFDRVEKAIVQRNLTPAPSRLDVRKANQPLLEGCEQ